MVAIVVHVYLLVNSAVQGFSVLTNCHHWIYYKITFHQGHIHFAGNQIARVVMFACHTPLLVVQEKLKILPLLVVQEKLKMFNVGQAFETQLELHTFSTDSHFHLDKLRNKLKVNTLS